MDKVEDGAKPSPLDSSQNLEKKEKTTNTKKELINRRYKVIRKTEFVNFLGNFYF